MKYSSAAGQNAAAASWKWLQAGKQTDSLRPKCCLFSRFTVMTEKTPLPGKNDAFLIKWRQTTKAKKSKCIKLSVMVHIYTSVLSLFHSYEAEKRFNFTFTPTEVEQNVSFRSQINTLLFTHHSKMAATVIRLVVSYTHMHPSQQLSSNKLW